MADFDRYDNEGGGNGFVMGLITGTVLGAKVADARIGLVSGFGMITYDRGLASGAVLLAGMDA